jgi:hypothetical protein
MKKDEEMKTKRGDDKHMPQGRVSSELGTNEEQLVSEKRESTNNIFLLRAGWEKSGMTIRSTRYSSPSIVDNRSIRLVENKRRKKPKEKESKTRNGGLKTAFSTAQRTEIKMTTRKMR